MFVKWKSDTSLILADDWSLRLLYADYIGFPLLLEEGVRYLSLIANDHGNHYPQYHDNEGRSK